VYTERVRGVSGSDPAPSALRPIEHGWRPSVGRGPDPTSFVTPEALEAEIASLRAEQKRCARLLARLDDAPEIEAEYQARTERIRSLESDVAAARAAPRAAVLATQAIAAHVVRVFTSLRQGLVAAPSEARDALRLLFPRGLRFKVDEERGGFLIEGNPEISLG